MPRTHDLVAGFCVHCNAPVRLHCPECNTYMYRGQAHRATHVKAARARGDKDLDPLASFICQCQPREVIWGERPRRFKGPVTNEEEFNFEASRRG